MTNKLFVILFLLLASSCALTEAYLNKNSLPTRSYVAENTCAEFSVSKLRFTGEADYPRLEREVVEAISSQTLPSGTHCPWIAKIELDHSIERSYGWLVFTVPVSLLITPFWLVLPWNSVDNTVQMRFTLSNRSGVQVFTTDSFYQKSLTQGAFYGKSASEILTAAVKKLQDDLGNKRQQIVAALSHTDSRYVETNSQTPETS